MTVNESCPGTESTCRYKNTERSDELQADLQKRLNRVIGQLNGIKNMIGDNRYCGDILIQLAAAEKAVQGIALLVLQEHMETCLIEELRTGNEAAVEEVVGLIKRFT